MAGALQGLKVVEFEGLGPVPHATAILTALGADVVRVRRPKGMRDPTLFGGRIVELNLRRDADRETALQLLDQADVLLEGGRPGVMERLGLAPDVVLARNPGLVYGRMTGWGQDGPLAATAGHDINYVSITGALAMIGTPDKPLPPINFVGDYGGGSMLLVIGVLAALVEKQTSDKGQVVDAAIVDGVATMLPMFRSWAALGGWHGERGANILDGGAPYYRTYRCADGNFVAVGAMEPQFYAALLDGLGLNPSDLPDQNDESGWPTLHETFATTFAEHTRDTWISRFAGLDACVTPVRTLLETDEHMAARGVFAADGRTSGAPRFSRSNTTWLGGGTEPREATPSDILTSWGAHD